MTIVVAKFGGTSMATADSIRSVRDILKANPSRLIAVVSAPGKVLGAHKMTDLLIENKLQACAERVSVLVEELGLGCRTRQVVMGKLHTLAVERPAPTRISFGEWFSAYLLSKVLDWELVDATNVLFFDGDHVRVEASWLPGRPVVIPGFYGHDVNSRSVRLFPRGGSDITASLIAEKVGASLCENWTDVPGVFDKDPNHHEDARVYPELSYEQLLDVSKGGAQVFHHEAIAPIKRANIPLHIRSTFAPHAPGTVVSQRSL